MMNRSFGSFGCKDAPGIPVTTIQGTRYSIGRIGPIVTIYIYMAWMSLETAIGKSGSSIPWTLFGHGGVQKRDGKPAPCPTARPAMHRPS